MTQPGVFPSPLPLSPKFTTEVVLPLDQLLPEEQRRKFVIHFPTGEQAELLTQRVDRSGCSLREWRAGVLEILQGILVGWTNLTDPKGTPILFPTDGVLVSSHGGGLMGGVCDGELHDLVAEVIKSGYLGYATLKASRLAQASVPA